MHRMLTILGLVAAGSAAFATESMLTLEEAVAAALDHDHALAAAGAGVEAEEARLAEARGGALPRISLEENFARTTNPALVFTNLLGQESFTAENFDIDTLNRPPALDNFNTRVLVEQPLWLGGRTRRASRAADESVQAARADRELARQQVVRRVIDLYTAAVLAEAQLAVAEEALATSRANTRLVADLREGGLVVESDLLQATVRETELEELKARAFSQAAVSRASLNLAMGRGADSPLALPDALARPPGPADDLEALVAEARMQRPDLAAARARVQAGEHAVRLERSAGLPSIGVAGAYESNAEQFFHSDGTNWSLFASLRWTAFGGGTTRARVRRAEAEARRARRMAAGAEEAAEIDVRRAYHGLEAADKRLEQAERSIGLAEESLRIVRDRYREGLTTLVELLEAETALTRARSRELAALRDLWMTDAALKLATGNL